MGLYTLLMLSSFFGLLVTILTYLTRSFGYAFRVHRIRLRSLHNISYSSRKRSLSISKIGIKLHRPRRDNPYWAVIAMDELEYKDEECYVSLQRGEAKLWLLPVFFRFTSGPWIATTLHGFTVHVYTSKVCPWWVETIRRNLIAAVLDGETIRLNHSDTKVYLSSLTKPLKGYSGKVETPGLREEDPQDELRVRSSLSQWHILSQWNARMYTFDDLQVEIRRSWVEDRGSFVMIAKDCRWTKVPVFGQQEGYRKASALWQLLYALYSLPINMLRVCIDPMSTVDLYAPRADITFGDFRLRDAELFHKGAVKLQQEYYNFDTRYPGIMGEYAWDFFVQGILSTFQH